MRYFTISKKASAVAKQPAFAHSKGRPDVPVTLPYQSPALHSWPAQKEMQQLLTVPAASWLTSQC